MTILAGGCMASWVPVSRVPVIHAGVKIPAGRTAFRIRAVGVRALALPVTSVRCG
jgi:hypothetical protein